MTTANCKQKKVIFERHAILEEAFSYNPRYKGMTGVDNSFIFVEPNTMEEYKIYCVKI